MKLVKTLPHLGGLPRSWFSTARALSRSKPSRRRKPPRGA